MADAGWYPDPFGRYEHRYHDGTAWTEHVATAGNAIADPLGATPSVPFATPASALPPPVASAFAAPVTPGAASSGPADAGSTGGAAATSSATSSATQSATPFTHALGPDARQRPRPRASGALGAGGGLVTSLGVLALSGEEVSRGVVVVLGIALVAAGWVLLKVALPAAADLRAAAVAAGSVGIAAFVIGATGDSDTGAWFLAALLFTVAYLVPTYRGRTFMLGAGLLSAVVGIAVATASSGGELGGGSDYFDDYFTDLQNRIGDQGTVFVLCAGILTIAMVALDRKGYHGVATAFAAVALISAIIGIPLFATNLGDETGPLLLTAIGLALVGAGRAGGRRATMWFGATLATGAAVASAMVILEPTSTTGIAFVLILTGALLGVGPRIVRAVAARSDSASTPATPGS